MTPGTRAPAFPQGRAAPVEFDSSTVSPIERLRAKQQEAAPEDGLLLASLKIRIPPKGPWTGAFSRTHPGLFLDVLNRSEVTEDVSVSDYWIGGRPPGVWAREIAGFPDIVKAESLAEVGEGSIYRITYRNPPIIYLYRKLRLPLHFPFRIQGGFIHWEVAARRSELDTIIRYARQVDPEFQLTSIRRRPLRTHLPVLTDAQQQLLTQAMAAGYFAVPRAITLTNLAHQIGRSKSSVSEAIAIIERKLLESALRPGGIDPR